MDEERSLNQMQESALNRLRKAIIANEIAASRDFDLEESTRLDDELRRASLEASNLDIPHLEITKTYLGALSQVSPESVQSFFDEVVGDGEYERDILQKLSEDFNLNLSQEPFDPS